jgi:hypothetical protein
MQLAPLPMMATRLPATEASSGQRAVCHFSPVQVSIPGMSGSMGGLNRPAALMTTLASRTAVRPSASRVSIDQVWLASWYVMRSTEVLKLMYLRTSNSRDTCSR